MALRLLNRLWGKVTGNRSQCKRFEEEARQSVALALAYFDQGGYEKSVDLLLQAADLYDAMGKKEDEKRTLLAAAHVKATDTSRSSTIIGLRLFPA